MSDKKFIGRNLKIIRQFHGMTLEELGEKVTASRQYVNQLEIGSKHPNQDFINALCDALDVMPGFFYMQINEVKEDELT